MSDKMLKFVKIGQQKTHLKDLLMREIRTLKKFIENLLMKKLKLNLADAHSVVFLFAKFIVL